ncbi:MAG: ATP-binding cassette domain-containing protein [Gammaproteobacteria bacterium]|jgi:ABC-type iron transport system FetAB ATPase subunit|nr:ATP-binding cassette domain-containing protein [Gammaproteobacteria bacterium]MBT3490288.1 ATP-binding cassette domain-containing protein [Gammaproteobacteria bacterium]MBT3719303.1 ATP-binding cassette domain-containing protein [Gammaproteobacteria bacterium]MBT3845540.1 ATP-binding cassette domain-containing protein [Gammaproteobacteria bacterium]MBT3893354.1 ATP-binding cassette domain-containing protein [Gammaproteobacteria bacterium]
MQALTVKQLVTFHLGPIELSVAEGETASIYGPSGSGKTLLLRAIADLDPHQGEVWLKGQKQCDTPPNQWRKAVAYCAAESQWWGDLVTHHFPSEHDPAHLSLWFEMGGFTSDVLNWSVDRLSSGEKQRLSIIRQLVRQPEVLLLDEPTANLDPDNGQRIEEMIAHYQLHQRATVIWVSHNQLQLNRVSHHIFRMDNGQLYPAEKNS